jgi:Ca-activated chloride channel family protein
VVKKSDKSFNDASADLKFATGVASFGMLLRKDDNVKNMPVSKILETAKESKGDDKFGYRQEFIELIEVAKSIKKSQ